MRTRIDRGRGRSASGRFGEFALRGVSLLVRCPPAFGVLCFVRLLGALPAQVTPHRFEQGSHGRPVEKPACLRIRCDLRFIGDAEYDASLVHVVPALVPK